MSGNSEWTVGRYLATRLEQLGIQYLFGVPGDLLGPFLTIMHATTKVRWVGTPTEIGGGYAADAYARVRAADADLTKGEQGVAAVAVTYGVGAFSLLNPIGGAYVEYVPVIAINGAPSYEQWLNYQAVGLLTSHMSQRPESNLEVYRQVTVDAQVISNPGLAPSQIDSAIIAGLTERRPVYLEVMEDLWHAPCAEPQGELRRQERPFTKKNEEMLAKAVEASVKLVERLGTPVLWAGEELERNRLEQELVSLVRLTGIPFFTTVGAKSVVSENTPGFTGVYNGRASLPEVREAFQAAGCRIGLGTWSTSKNLGGEKSIGDDWIVAARDGVSVGAQYFPDIQLARFVPALRDALGAAFGERAFETDPFALAHARNRRVPASTAAFLTGLSSTDHPEELTYDGFFQHMNAFLLSQADGEGPGATSPFTVVSDAAFALLGSMNLRMAERASFVAQNSWLSIGYSVGAATGVALGRQDPLKRPLVFVGDGSFQEVCQELSTHVRNHLRPVVFVLDNEGFYGIEQMLVSPCYYKEKPSDGADFYNVLHPWRYEKLAEVFGSEKDRMHGRELTTHTELESLLLEIADPGNDINHAPILARIRLNRHDYPRALQYKIDEKCG